MSHVGSLLAMSSHDAYDKHGAVFVYDVTANHSLALRAVPDLPRVNAENAQWGAHRAVALSGTTLIVGSTNGRVLAVYDCLAANGGPVRVVPLVDTFVLFAVPSLDSVRYISLATSSLPRLLLVNCSQEACSTSASFAIDPLHLSLDSPLVTASRTDLYIAGDGVVHVDLACDANHYGNDCEPCRWWCADCDDGFEGTGACHESVFDPVGTRLQWLSILAARVCTVVFFFTGPSFADRMR